MSLKSLLSARVPWRAVLVAASIAISILAIVANPWVIRPDIYSDPVGDGVLIVQGYVAVAWLLWVCVARMRDSRDFALRGVASQSGASSEPVCHTSRSRLMTALGGTVILVLWCLMFRQRIADPQLIADDHQYTAVARTWSTTRAQLFTPYNEHFCVPTRIATWVVCALVPEPSWPQALAWSGLGLFVATWVPLFLLASRIWNSATAGLVSVSLFAITPVHDEVVWWYSASQWCWALLLLLLGLVWLQPAGAGRSPWRLGLAMAAAATAPLSYSVGVLVGPILSLWLWLQRRTAPSAVRTKPLAGCPESVPGDGGFRETGEASDRRRLGWLICSLPSAATVICLLVVVPWKGSQILAKANYAGLRPAEAISWSRGMLYGVRSTVDLLLLDNIGIRREVQAPRVYYAVLFPILVATAAELIRRATAPNAAIVGLSMILFSYAAMLPFRAWVLYAHYLTWTRYQLLPQLGLVLILGCALFEFGPRWLTAPGISVRQLGFVLTLAAIQFAVHTAFYEPTWSQSAPRPVGEKNPRNPARQDPGASPAASACRIGQAAIPGYAIHLSWLASESRHASESRAHPRIPRNPTAVSASPHGQVLGQTRSSTRPSASACT